MNEGFFRRGRNIPAGGGILERHSPGRRKIFAERRVFRLQFAAKHDIIQAAEPHRGEEALFMEEFGPDFVTVTDEDGNDIELELVDADRKSVV